MVLQCSHSILSTAIPPHLISPTPQAHDLLLRTIRPVESIKWGWEWQTDVHKNASTVLKKKHNVLHLSALNADVWDLNGVFGCIILNCIIRNYGPYAMRLWHLRGHSYLHEQVTGILMDRGRPMLKFSAVGLHIQSACQLRSLTSFDSRILSICIPPGYFKPHSSATNTYLLSCAKQSPRQSSVQKRDHSIFKPQWKFYKLRKRHIKASNHREKASSTHPKKWNVHFKFSASEWLNGRQFSVQAWNIFASLKV